MIANIGGANGIDIIGGSSSVPYIPLNSSNVMTGMIRVCNYDYQAYNGSSWVPLTNNYAVVQLDESTQQIIAWAKDKMEQESKYAEAAARHESVAFALQAVGQARQDLDLIVQLCSDNTKSTQNA